MKDKSLYINKTKAESNHTSKHNSADLILRHVLTLMALLRRNSFLFPKWSAFGNYEHFFSTFFNGYFIKRHFKIHTAAEGNNGLCLSLTFFFKLLLTFCCCSILQSLVLSVIWRVRFVDKPTRPQPKNKLSMSPALKWDIKKQALGPATLFN